ncbi:hypothetical protein [Bacillus sp. JCM 19034]|uniref:hypothetical protein n=1 Tax=Bacillus sp. JCM 19034 TaxID=1481928 RepID=UPI000A9C118D|nr:hypothetical protein [Bacillus sp. JCM 19034]
MAFYWYSIPTQMGVRIFPLIKPTFLLYVLPGIVESIYFVITLQHFELFLTTFL